MKFSMRAFLMSAAILVAPAVATSAQAYTLIYTGNPFTEAYINYPNTGPVDPAFGTSLDFKITLDLPSNYTGTINSDSGCCSAYFTSFTYTPVGGNSVVDNANVAANVTQLDLVNGLPETWFVTASNIGGAEYLSSSWNGSSGNDQSTGAPYGLIVNVNDSHGVWAIDGAGGVPEPATWAFMVMGLGMIGAATRAARRKTVAAA